MLSRSIFRHYGLTKPTIRLASSSAQQSASTTSKPTSTSTSASTSASASPESKQAPASPETPKPKRKTQTELDDELRQKMSGLSGDGGESGVEYEDGQPVSMKRSVKNNMFRYI
ncbi:hypothetical protein MBLNU457_5390t1 [Dothideomycetes sp. NU457]